MEARAKDQKSVDELSGRLLSQVTAANSKLRDRVTEIEAQLRERFGKDIVMNKSAIVDPISQPQLQTQMKSF